MILTGPAIAEAVARGEILIDPFDPACVNPNSYDFHLGDRILTYTCEVLDAARPNPYRVDPIPPEGALLRPDRIYLANTLERIGSDRYVPIIRARSSTARLGLFVHVTADLIDLGSKNQLTLQLHAVLPVRIFPGMRIAQVTFWATEGEPCLYNGKYSVTPSPSPSLSYRDFRKAKNEDHRSDPRPDQL